VRRRRGGDVRFVGGVYDALRSNERPVGDGADDLMRSGSGNVTGNGGSDRTVATALVVTNVVRLGVDSASDRSRGLGGSASPGWR
jgi:hypothetical protein